MTTDTSRKVIVDENIPYGAEAFSEFGDVTLVSGREISNSTLKDADILIIRSITRVDEALLKGTRVRFVGTATIGTDHVDAEYLRNADIKFVSAAGCNSNSVKEYVLSAIFHFFSAQRRSLEGAVIGIYGAGNIGSKLWKAAESLGMTTLISDPPLYRKTGDPRYTTLRNIRDCDIITVHVPLTTSGEDKTYRLLDDSKIASLKENTILFNTSRGGVIDEAAVLKSAEEKKLIRVFDVWENEPFLNSKFAGACDISTPHIAGYSFEGKVNGTKMIYGQLCEFLGVKPVWEPELPALSDPVITPENKESAEALLNDIARKSYDILEDDKRMRIALRSDSPEKEFDNLRKNYPVRREFGNYSLNCSGLVEEFLEKIENAGFRLHNKINGDN